MINILISDLIFLPQMAYETFIVIDIKITVGLTLFRLWPTKIGCFVRTTSLGHFVYGSLDHTSYLWLGVQLGLDNWLSLETKSNTGFHWVRLEQLDLTWSPGFNQHFIASQCTFYLQTIGLVSSNSNIGWIKYINMLLFYHLFWNIYSQ